MTSKIIREEYSGISNSSSLTELADIAARVIRELGHVSPPDSLDEFISPGHQQVIIEDHSTKQLLHLINGDNQNDDDAEEEEEEEEEFEFSFASVEPDVTADEIFFNGQIRPLYYPLFDTALLNDQPSSQKYYGDTTSEADKPEGVPAEDSYCVWNPKKKNNETTTSGSASKRWKLKNILLLLGRSNSVDENKDKNSSDNKYRVVVFTNKSRVELGGYYRDLKRRSYLPFRLNI